MTEQSDFQRAFFTELQWIENNVLPGILKPCHRRIFYLLFPAFFWLGLRMVGGFNVGFVGVVSIGISALPRRYYESRCTHLRERVAPAVAWLLRRT
jgi:hypothetical protein